MLLDSLYSIDKLATEEGRITAELTIDSSHKIFDGHFPSQPVLPGVCLIEMLKDLLKKATNKPYQLSQAQNIKYLKVVDPVRNGVLTFELKTTETDGALQVAATSQLEDGSVNFKFKGLFV